MALRMRTLHPATRNRDALRCDGSRTRPPRGPNRPAILEYLSPSRRQLETGCAQGGYFMYDSGGASSRKSVTCHFAQASCSALRECTFGDAITIKCLRGLGLEAPPLTGLRPPSGRLEAG